MDSKTGFKLPLLTLQHSALIKTATNLWKSSASDISHVTKNSGWNNLSSLYENWPKIQEIVSKKISDLVLPQTLLRLLTPIIRFTGEEIRHWLQLTTFNRIFPANDDIVYKVIDCTQHVIWTPRGKIDYRETSRVLPTLINIFTPAELSEITNTVTLDAQKHEPIKIHMKYDAVRTSLQNGNESALMCTWSALTNDERNDFLNSGIFAVMLEVASMSFSSCSKYRSFGCLLLLLDEQQLDIFLSKYLVPAMVLKGCLHDWVYVDLFVAVANRVRVKLRVEMFRELVYLTAQQIVENRQSDVYKACFADLWANASSEFRQDFAQFEIRYNFPCSKMLQNVQDNRSVGLILDELPVDARNKFLSTTSNEQ